MSQITPYKPPISYIGRKRRWGKRRRRSEQTVGHSSEGRVHDSQLEAVRIAFSVCATHLEQTRIHPLLYSGERGRTSVSPATRKATIVESAYTEGMTQQNADQAVHKAARAGLSVDVAEMLATDPSLIEAKGMDARTPLHCAGTVAVAALLLDHGARIDARRPPV